MSSSPWTLDLVARLVSLFHLNLSFGVIANDLGLTRNACIGKAGRMKLRRASRKPQRQLVSSRPVMSTLPKSGPKLRYHIGVQDQFNAPYVEKIDFSPAVADTEIPLAQRKTLMQLEAYHCRFPVGEPTEPDFFFCGGTIVDGSPYCAHHTKICFTAAPPKPSRYGFRPRV